MTHRYRVQDDSVTVPGKGHPRYSGRSITPRGEDRRKGEAEPGRYSVESDHREYGQSTARDSTSVRPLDPIVSGMPNLRTP